MRDGARGLMTVDCRRHLPQTINQRMARLPTFCQMLWRVNADAYHDMTFLQSRLATCLHVSIKSNSLLAVG